MADVETEVRFGRLVLAFTSAFDFVWNDKGSGGSHDGGFWQPRAPQGFKPLGGLAVQGYGDPNGRNWALCVAEAEPGALARPQRYDRIWQDKGSGADLDGSCWRAVPPQGYLALGDVFMRNHDTPPPLDAIACVASELTTFGVLGDLIWNDVNTGSDQDFACWVMNPPVSLVTDDRGAFAANTYYGVASHTKPTTPISVLCTAFPVVSGQTPLPPTLDSRSQPPERTVPAVDRTVTVPFTAVVDPGVDLQWQLKNSPFYTVSRSVYYRLELFDDNRTSEVQTKRVDVTVGVSETTTTTFSVQTGITVGYETGVSFGVTAKASASISIQLGFAYAYGVTSMQSRTLAASLSTPPNHSAALWDISYLLTLYRADRAPVSQSLDFSANGSFLEQQYPPAAAGAAVTTRHFPPIAA